MATKIGSSIKISHNCKQVTVATTIDPKLHQGPYTLSVASATTSETINLGNNFTVYTVLDLETSGVVQAVITDGSGQEIVRFATVATCQIDCCIAKLVESAITCTCKCDKCKEELDRAEKIFLLLQAAVYAAEVDENIKDATDKYAKANEMCTEVCACGC